MPSWIAPVPRIGKKRERRRVLVVDASALAAVAFDDQSSPEVTARLAGEDLHAPALFGLEMANATVNRCKRTPAQADRLIAGFRHVMQMPISLHEVDPIVVFAIATESGLTAYDAAYLWLSRHLGAPLVTLDKQLAAAARRR
jgi:predicted nucleic acid-binding protein